MASTNPINVSLPERLGCDCTHMLQQRKISFPGFWASGWTVGRQRPKNQEKRENKEKQYKNREKTKKGSLTKNQYFGGKTKKSV